MSIKPDFFPEKESGQAVTLMLKTNIYKSKLIVIQHFASLELSESNTDFIDRLYLASQNTLPKIFSSYGVVPE